LATLDRSSRKSASIAWCGAWFNIGRLLEEVEAMHQAWVRAVLLQVILWSHSHVRDGDFWRAGHVPAVRAAASWHRR
jgi:hypothetical protein